MFSGETAPTLYALSQPFSLALRSQVSFWKDVEQQEQSGSKRQTVRNETSVVLSGLDGNSLYHVTVRGFNTIGQGPPSAATTARTRKTREYTAPSDSFVLVRHSLKVNYFQGIFSYLDGQDSGDRQETESERERHVA